MKNGDNSAELERLYIKAAEKEKWNAYWAAERKKGIQMKRGGKWKEENNG